MMILSTVTFESRASIWPLGWPSRSPLANDIWGWLSYALFHAWFEIFLPDISSSHWFWNIWFEDSTVLFQTVRRFLIQWIVRIWFLNKYLYILEDCHQAVDFWVFNIFLFRPRFFLFRANDLFELKNSFKRWGGVLFKDYVIPSNEVEKNKMKKNHHIKT